MEKARVGRRRTGGEKEDGRQRGAAGAARTAAGNGTEGCFHGVAGSGASS